MTPAPPSCFRTQIRLVSLMRPSGSDPFLNNHLSLKIRQQADPSLPTAAQLDLTTPSCHVTFVRVTEAARTALAHFSTSARPPTQAMVFKQFCEWLSTYRCLFTEPCMNCRQLLGQDAAFPVLRTLHHAATPTEAKPLHEQCRVVCAPASS